MNIQNKIVAWQKAGLISSKQAQALSIYESNAPKPYLLYIFIALGVFFIGAGIVSVVAANWDAISPICKLSADFSLLLVTAVTVLFAADRNKNLLFEGALFFFALLVLASIGLIAQIYQLQSNDLSAFLLWSFLVFPLLFFTKKPFLSCLVIPIMWLSAFDSLFYLPFVQKVNELWDESPYLIWLLAWVLVYQFLSLGGSDKFKNIKSVLIIVITICAASMFADADAGSSLTWRGFSAIDYHNGEVMALLAIPLLQVLLSFYLDYKGPNNKFIPLIMLLLFISTLFNIYFFITFAALSVSGYYAYRYQKNKYLSLVIFLAVWRILALFSDIFESLLSSGLGLITFGLLVVIVALSSVKLGAVLNGRTKNVR